MGRLSVAACVVSLLVVACGTTRRAPRLTSENVVIEVRQHAGSTLRGPKATPIKRDPSEFHSVVVEFFALERLPADVLAPITDRLDLVVEIGEGELFLPAPRFMQGTRTGIGDEAQRALYRALADGMAGETLKLGQASGVIALGTTVDFQVANREPQKPLHLVDDARESVLLDVNLTEDGKTYLTALGVVRIVSPEPPLPTAGLDRAESEQTLSEREANTLEAVRREAVLVSVPADADTVRFAALIPAPHLATGGTAIAALITVTAAPSLDAPGSVEHKEKVSEFEKTQDEVNAAREDERLATSVERQLWKGLKSALTGLDSPATRRSALAYLGRTTGADLTEDVALGASDQAVDLIVSRALAKIGTPPERPEAEWLGFLLESVSYRVIFDFLRNREAPPVVEGLLLRHAGEVARHQGILSETIEDSTSLAELRRDLVRENIIFLEDSSPVSRVRAFDWLTQIGMAPEGYDPLAPRKERRIAIMRFLDERREAGEMDE